MAGTVAKTFCSAAGPGTYADPNKSGWQGGQLQLVATSSAWGGGSVQFQQSVLGTWVNLGTAFTANGTQIVQSPAGQIQAVVTTSTGVTASAYSVPSITTR